MSTLANHRNSWMRDDAAAAFNRAEADHGILVVNSAGRTVAQQQALINRWNAGGASNRPPYLYKPAMPAGASNHVAGGGIAIDIGNWSKFAQYCTAYGFTHPYPGGDPVHFEYHGGPAPAVSSQIKDIQTFLNTIGYHLVVDGINGPRTKEALKGYQMMLRGYGYTGAIDGIWGAGTSAAHTKYVAAHGSSSAAGFPTTVPAGSDHISWFQRALNRFGYGLAVDNVWGPKSHNALGDFQTKHGLTRDYVVGPATWKALIK